MNEQAGDGQLVTGIFTLLGVAVGLFGERWVRTLGGMECEGKWEPMSSSGAPPNVRVESRLFTATFLNRKDVAVTVWNMRVEFYKEGQPLDKEDRPGQGNGLQGESLDLVSLPPRTPVTRRINLRVRYLPPEKQRVVEEADRVQFVAIIDGAKDIRIELNPWPDMSVQTVRWQRRWWEFWR